jgi:hypothetical protein
MRLAPAATVAAAAALLLVGCGSSPGDVLAIEVSGGPLPARQTIVVSLDGRATCNRGNSEEIENSQLIDAREVAREAKPLAEAGADYRTPRPGARLYLLRLPEGEVPWTEGRPGLPAALAKAQLLSLQLGRSLCGRA